ncbi:MAG TPA: ATP-binding protein, partial [Steroidobacteraceae bacterium]|nr:ATP-binding protein [Steroidobacteraceae bacterium]
MNSEHHVSLKRKVLLPLMVATVTVFAGLTFLVYQNRNRYVQSVMRARAENIAAAIQYGANSVRSPETLKRFVQAFQNESGIEFIVVVVGSPAHVLAGTRDDWQGVPVANLAEFGDPQNFAAVTTDSPTQINYTTQRYLLVKHAHFTADWLGNEKERDGAVAVSLDTSQFNAELARTFRRTLVVFSAAMALLALFAWHLLRRNVVVPLNSIAKSLDAGDTHIAAPEDAPRPIARMADSLNASMSKVRDAESQAQAASVAKGEFLARVSHEIRTPMNGVMGMMEALLNTPLTEEQSDYLRAAYASADSLLRLINDLLDCSKIEAGKMTIESIDFDLESLAHQIVQLWERRADEKGVTLSAYIDPSAPKWLRGDPMRLGQILGNLVSNALKFTPQGTVDIRIDVVDQQIDSVALRFSVADTGIGIEPEAKARLFTPFTQADGSTSRRFGGTGLGLAICHELVKLMGGGAIKLDSAVGRGSQFEFTLPFQRAAGRVPQSTTKSNAASLANTGKILVVDDNDTNRKVLVVMLRRLGLDCESACDGFEAINDVQTREFSLVLMDCHMP